MTKSLENSENFAALLASHDAAPRACLEAGQKVEGTIIAISGDNVFVDVGLKQDGAMDKADLPEGAQPGDKVTAYVTAVSSQGIQLSRSMSGAGLAALEDAMAAGIPVEGRVKSACKGGYAIETLGKTAFCPGSQIGMAGLNGDEDLSGRQMQFLITRIENHGRNIVVSARALQERQRAENLEALLEKTHVGDTVEGQITRLAPFGAFMELAPGVEGMIHLSELSWTRIEQADEAVSVGDMAAAKIIGMDKDDKGRLRIALSIKQAEGDPWLKVSEKFKVGQITQGKVRRLAPFGAFVEIAPGIEGLVHLSEMAWGKRVNRAEDAVSLGEEVSVKIGEIKPENRRISLSIRDAQGDPWQDAEEKYPAGTIVLGVVESRSQHGLFISLAPGVTGLLPASVMAKAANASALAKLAAGDNIKLMVQKLDSAARRISLKTIDDTEDQSVEEQSWKEHAAISRQEPMGLMAQAFQKAMQKKEKKA